MRWAFAVSQFERNAFVVRREFRGVAQPTQIQVEAHGCLCLRAPKSRDPAVSPGLPFHPVTGLSLCESSRIYSMTKRLWIHKNKNTVAAKFLLRPLFGFRSAV